MPIISSRLLAAGLAACALPSFSQAQTPSTPLPAPDFVVTPTRTPQAISRAGSAVTVITADEIAKESPKSVADVLRRSPGLSITESGGPGSSTTVRIRGAESRHTLVLIDGVRVTDPSQASAEFDFAQLVPTDIERIEVLRGPQSALYGSDAIGGVINVITRKGRGAPRFSVSTEAGSYGSKGGRAAVSGSTGPLSYAFSLSGYDTTGFSRYGYRIGRIERTRLWPLEADATKRLGASGKVSLALNKDVDLEVGGYASLNNAEYDAGFGDFPDTPSQAKQRLFQGYTRLTALAFDGVLRNTLLLSAGRTERDYKDISFFGVPLVTTWNRDGYVGDRIAAEYQGDLKLGGFGLLTVGTRLERERLVSESRSVLPVPTPLQETNDASALTRSAYAIYQTSLWQNLHLSFGGRIDDVEGHRGLCGRNGVCEPATRSPTETDTFATWRATAAYEIPESATTFRASLGTGAKAPTLFQQFDPTYGTPGLSPERSIGFDAGIDQRFLDDRLILSATVFGNRFRDLIDFSFDPAVCPADNPLGCFINVARARSAGVELSANIDVVPQWLRLRTTYTHLEAFDVTPDPLTGLVDPKRLARRPRDEARIGLIFTPVRDLSIEPTVVLVGSRFSSTGETDKLQPYARLDVYADYRINDTFSVFARAENLTGADYEEIRGYGTTGRAIYGGLRATW
jgi:vitamin B12 transporter